jgi:general secretion pathway protein K
MGTKDDRGIDRQAARDQGFALLLVLWGLALAALLVSFATSAGRGDVRAAEALRDAAQSSEAADAAVQETIWHLIEGSDSWRISAGRYRLDEDGVTVDIGLIDERGKIDINNAAQPLIEALLVTAGVDRSHAHDVAIAMLQWRSQTQDSDPDIAPAYRMAGLIYGPPGQDFQTLDELRLVRGMTPEIYTAIKPYVTLALEQLPWTRDVVPDVTISPVVLAAMQRAHKEVNLNLDPADEHGPQVFWIWARAHGPGQANFLRRVMVRLDGSLNGSSWKYRILASETGEPVPGE